MASDGASSNLARTFSSRGTRFLDGIAAGEASVSHGLMPPDKHAATIFGIVEGTVVEDGELTADGQVFAADPDRGEAGFVKPASLDGSYGSFAFDNGTGVWSYQLDNANAAVQALNGGQTLADTLRVQTIDGTTFDIVVTINGEAEGDVTGAEGDGTPVFSCGTTPLPPDKHAATIFGIVEGTVAEDGELTADGQVFAADPDRGEAGFVKPASLDGSYGSFAFDNGTGVWSYQLDNANAKVQALDGGQTLADTLRVQTIDGTTFDIVVTINGAAEGDGTGAEGDGTPVFSCGTTALRPDKDFDDIIGMIENAYKAMPQSDHMSDSFVFKPGFGNDQITEFGAGSPGARNFIQQYGFGSPAEEIGNHDTIADSCCEGSAMTCSDLDQPMLLAGIQNASAATVDDFRFA